MYRSVILEFLSTNSKVLLENNYSQMTLVLFPNEYRNLSKLYKDDSLIKIYHIKDQYTFYKEIELSKLENSIIEMILDNQETININYNDISFEINDPYYLKDIRKLNFLSLEIMPILMDNKLTGILLIYSNNLNAKFKLSNKKVLNLVNKLYLDEELTFEDDIKDEIINNEAWYYVVKKDNLYYLNDLISKSRRFSNNVINEKDKEVTRLKKLLSGMKKIIKDKVEIFYLPSKLFKVDNNNTEVYLLDSINNHNFTEDFSVIFTKNLESNMSVFEISSIFKQAINKIYPDAIIKFYQVSKDAMGIIVNKNFSKKDENDLKYLLKKHYFLLINRINGLTKGLELVKLMTYLNENLPFNFNYDEYSRYLEQKNEELLDCDKSINRYNKIMIKADTLQTIGKVVNAPLNNYYNLSIYKLHENELINLLDKIIKYEYISPIINMCIMSFNKRKIYEQLKKIILKYPSAKIIFHAPKIINHSVNEMYGNIIKAKELGFVVIVDSTIFMDLNYNICVKPCDAIIIRKQELKASLTDHNIFNKRIFESFYDDAKVVIFEELPKEEDLCIINELTCLFIDE